MPIEITMPALSPTMEDGTIATWLVQQGDQITPGDIIAEIETDKATMEFEASEAGRLARIIVSEGTENVPVNTVIALLAEDEEDIASIESGAVEQPVGLPKEPEANEVIGTTPASAPIDGPTRVFASPLARRIATENKLDINGLNGSGPKGRIVRADVDAAIVAGGSLTATAGNALPAAPAPAPVAGAGIYAEGSYEVVELDTMRRTIARRLTEAKQTVPHFYLRADIELDAMLALRKQLNDAAPLHDETPAYKISVNDLVIKALALALAKMPDANVTWADGNILRHRAVDVSVAVAIEGGLITPIIRNADTKSVSAISLEMKDLAARARARKLAPEEFQGGTTSVSNLGMFGVGSFDAVINPPQGTILAVGAGERRPVVQADALKTATVMTVTLSFDHRMIDGALGAQLLAAFKGFVEAPLTILC